MLRRLLATPSGEGRVVALLGLHEFLMLAATTAQGTAADALFLEAFPASRLPWVYGAGSLLSVVATVVYGLLRSRQPAARVHRTVVVGISLTLVLLRLAEPVLGSSLAFLFMLLVPVSAALLGLERVRLLNGALDSRSARRVLPVVGALGGIGATAGAFLVARLSTSLGTPDMFWFAAAFLLLTLWPARRLGTREQEVRRSPPAPARELLRRPYALLLMAVILLAAVLATFARFQVGAAAQATLPREQIASYYGTLYGILNAVSIVFAIVVSRAAITHLGVRFSLLAYPIVMAGAGLAGVVAPGLTVAGGTVFCERLLRQNVQRPTRRIATLPLPDPVRVRLAMTEEGVLTPAATLLTSVGILALLARLPWTVVPIFILVAALILLVVLLRVRRDYAGQLVAALHARTLKLDPAVDPDLALGLDPPARELLHRQVASALPENVALGLELLTGGGHATAETVSLVEKRWPAWPPWLRARAVPLLAESRTAEAKRFLDTLRAPDAQVQAAGPLDDDDAVRAALLDVGIGEPAAARDLAGNPDVSWRVRAAALAFVRRSALGGDEDIGRDEDTGGDNVDDEDDAVARTIDAWLTDDDAEARRAAVHVLSVGGPIPERHRAAFLEACLDGLSGAAGSATDADADADAEADFPRLSRALSALGDAAVAPLVRMATDPARSARALALLGAIEAPAARRALLAVLASEDETVRFRAANALAAAGTPPAGTEREELRQALERELASCRAARRERTAARARGEAAAPLAREAAADALWALERAFLVLAALEPGPPYRRLFLAVADVTGTQRSVAIEALDALLPAAWKPKFLPLLEDRDQDRDRDEEPPASPTDAPATDAAADDTEADSEDPDPSWRRRLARALASRGEDETTVADPTLDLALRLSAVDLFAGWRIRDLEVVAHAMAGVEPEPALVIRGAAVTNLRTAVLGSEEAAPPGTLETAPDEPDPVVLRIPLAAVYAAIADRPRCARPWLSALAGRLAAPGAGTTADLTRSHELSLASRAAEARDTPGGDVDLWRRIFFLKTSGLTQGLLVESLTAVARIARSLSVARGDVVVREGRTGHHFYLVCTGTLEVTVGDARIAVLAPGDAVGELALLSGERRMGSIRALEAGELLTIERTDFLDLLDLHPALVKAFSELIARRMPPA